jgi:predicted MFS family arabinose efflux permease
VRQSASRSATLWRSREFRALYAAELQSIIGDQLARVALAVLVYRRSGSPALTSLVFALSFAPALLGGIFLSGLADRFPGRRVMIWCDAIRAGLLVLIAADPGLPTVFVAVALAGTLGPVFRAAQQATLVSVLDATDYRAATGLRMMSGQLANLLGFSLGGLVVAAVGTRMTLLADAATFVVSSALIAAAVRRSEHTVAELNDTVAGLNHTKTAATSVWPVARIVARSRQLRALLAVAALAGFYVVPEGLAAPYAAHLHGGARAVGVLMAAVALGSVLGALLLLKLDRRSRHALMGPLALCAGLPLVACVWHPGLALTAVLWGLSGMCTAYQIDASASFMIAIPHGYRAQAAGLYNSCLIGAQGAGVVLFGVVADYVSISTAVALAGGLGAIAAGWPIRNLGRGDHASPARRYGLRREPE